jgi:hypothetical protein
MSSAHDRARVRGVAYQLKGSERDTKRIRLMFSAHAKRSVDGSSLCFGQVFGQADDRPASSAASSGGFHALSGVLEQRRLPDSSFAADDQCAAAKGKAIGKLVQELQLGISSDQISNCLRPSRGGHGPSIGNVACWFAGYSCGGCQSSR